MDGKTLAAINYIEEICKRMDSLMLDDMVGTVREALESEAKNTIHNSGYKQCEHDFKWSSISKYGTCKKCGKRMHG